MIGDLVVDRKSIDRKSIDRKSIDRKSLTENKLNRWNSLSPAIQKESSIPM